jgi:hypothetical protein
VRGAGWGWRGLFWQSIRGRRIQRTTWFTYLWEQKAQEKLQRMQYVCKKVERNVDVERRTLAEERACIQLSLRKNVSKIHSNMKRMTDMRQKQNKIAFNVRAVTHRFNFEKEVC